MVNFKHTGWAALIASAALLVPTGAAAAPSPAASCVSILTVYETQSGPGSVGAEVRELARAGVVSSIVTELPPTHASTPLGCAGGGE